MVNKFEDLYVWQEARLFVIEIKELTKAQEFNRDFNLAGQIVRSSRSVMANIAEGFGRFTYKDYKHYLLMARGSLTETQNHLYTALDLKYLTSDQFKNLYEHSVVIHKLLNGLIAHLKRSISSM